MTTKIPQTPLRFDYEDVSVSLLPTFRSVSLLRNFLKYLERTLPEFQSYASDCAATNGHLPEVPVSKSPDPEAPSPRVPDPEVLKPSNPEVLKPKTSDLKSDCAVNENSICHVSPASFTPKSSDPIVRSSLSSYCSLSRDDFDGFTAIPFEYDLKKVTIFDKIEIYPHGDNERVMLRYASSTIYTTNRRVMYLPYPTPHNHPFLTGLSKTHSLAIRHYRRYLEGIRTNTDLSRLEDRMSPRTRELHDLATQLSS